MTDTAKTTLTERAWVKHAASYNRNLWLAGLGAFAKAQALGAQTYAALVRQGTQVETQAIKVAGEKIEQAVADTRKRWSVVRETIEQTAKRSLAKLDIAGSADIDALVARIDAVKAHVEALGKKQ